MESKVWTAEDAVRWIKGHARVQVLRALPPHGGAVTINDQRYAPIAVGLRALYLGNCRLPGGHELRRADFPQLVVDPDCITTAIFALHGPHAQPMIAGGYHNTPDDWFLSFRLPCELRGSDFRFDATTFGVTVELDDGQWTGKVGAAIQQIRANHPELSEWDDLAIGCAWGDYSRDILETKWADWINTREDAFLAYIYVRQAHPEFDFGGSGLFASSLSDYALQLPWETGAPLPALDRDLMSEDS
ncbi:hypothetical protein Tamer19_12360 [Cupriavidus sp. TA19]|uniref:hypothetical protein n=1 Tax=unclassified Cupriavidus TaxID=2640874 RepID=UPI000E2F852D|nr:MULTISPECIES: hypothetical protein [unclassified Cupriavidus]BDB30728.1 hypothetical protein CTP10_R81450 [Cupriavidus sp. P-10]GLC91828.1 hypothetical protein Tamer19_12360 [Cupriavidus sp. TA19]